MIGWIILAIIGGLLLLVLILLQFSITAGFEYHGDFTVKVRYLFIKLYPTESAKKRFKKRVKKRKQKLTGSLARKPQTFTEKVARDTGLDKVARDVSEVTEAGKKTSPAGFDFEMLKLIYDSARPALRKLVGKVRVEKLELYCVIGGDDAAKIALSYGFQSAAISAGLAWLNEVLTLKVKRVNVTADFEKVSTDMRVKCRVKIKAASALICLIQLAIATARNDTQKTVKKKTRYKEKQHG
jgi:hypothetical protein